MSSSSLNLLSLFSPQPPLPPPLNILLCSFPSGWLRCHLAGTLTWTVCVCLCVNPVRECVSLPGRLAPWRNRQISVQSIAPSTAFELHSQQCLLLNKHCPPGCNCQPQAHWEEKVIKWHPLIKHKSKQEGVWRRHDHRKLVRGGWSYDRGGLWRTSGVKPQKVGCSQAWGNIRDSKDPLRWPQS